MALCRHKRRGIVANESFLRTGRAEDCRASIATCDRPACLTEAIRWAAGRANERAAYRADPQPEPARAT